MDIFLLYLLTHPMPSGWESGWGTGQVGAYSDKLETGSPLLLACPV